MKKYFTITEQTGDHIATIKANTGEEMQDKIKRATSEHFSTDIYPLPFLNINDCLFGKQMELQIKSDEVITTIFIQETWIY